MPNTFQDEFNSTGHWWITATNDIMYEQYSYRYSFACIEIIIQVMYNAIKTFVNIYILPPTPKCYGKKSNVLNILHLLN